MRKLETSAGFTLIEALIALLVFALASAGLANLIRLSFVQGSENLSRAHAVSIAEDAIERIRAVPYDDMTGRTASETREGVTYSIVSSLQRNSPAANMTTVTTTISWNGRGASKQYGTQTIFTALND